MMRTRRLLLVPALVLFGVLATTGVAAAQTPPSGGFVASYTCTGSAGGVIPPGTYGSMTITGVCYMPAGNITIQGNLTVTPGALLDAVSPGDPASDPVVPATVLVGGNVSVGSGAVLLFGCSPNISCATANGFGISYDRINGNLSANGAQGVVVHSASIGGNASVVGGGGGAAAETCNAQVPGTPTVSDLEPWSLDPNFDYTPVYTDFEDTTVGGGLTVSGMTSCWLGSLRNQVGGNATFTNNTMGDPDALEIDNNLVNGNMACSGNLPAVQFGDGGSAPNIVGGNGSGECGFDVVLPTPAPEAGAPFPPISEHIAVKKASLGMYTGTHTDTSSPVTIQSITTESGDIILGQVSDFALGGNGLTGTGTVNPNPMVPPNQSGDAFLATEYPNGTTEFTVYETCDTCSFQGQNGAVTLRAYGTISASGAVNGTFLVTSGGPYLFPSPPQGPGGEYMYGESTGALGTLAGYGTFTSSGAPSGTLNLVEYLGFA